MLCYKRHIEKSDMFWLVVTLYAMDMCFKCFLKIINKFVLFFFMTGEGVDCLFVLYLIYDILLFCFLTPCICFNSIAKELNAFFNLVNISYKYSMGIFELERNHWVSKGLINQHWSRFTNWLISYLCFMNRKHMCETSVISVDDSSWSFQGLTSKDLTVMIFISELKRAHKHVCSTSIKAHCCV